MHIELGFAIAAVLATFFVGLSKGGMQVTGMLATPILSLQIDPLRAAAILLPVFIISDAVGVWTFRKRYDARNLAILIPSALFGIFLGWLLAASVPERAVGAMIGAIGLAYVIYAHSGLRRLSSVRRRPSRVVGWICGIMSGFTSFVSHSGAPPYQIYVLPQRLDKLVYAGTSAIVFASMNAAKLVPYWALGEFPVSTLKISMMLIPVGVLSTLLGVYLVKVIPEKAYYTLAEILLAAISIQLIYINLAST
jgi:uncharacterized protein